MTFRNLICRHSSRDDSGVKGPLHTSQLHGSPLSVLGNRPVARFSPGNLCLWMYSQCPAGSQEGAPEGMLLPMTVTSSKPGVAYYVN